MLDSLVGERLVKSGLDPRAKREIGSGSGKAKGDISNGLDLHLECKNQKRADFTTWFK